MSDTLPDPHDDLPHAVAVPRRRWAVPLVWIIPLVAALVGGWVALHYLLSRGPTITITFKNAEGVEAGKTKIRYKDVDIGTVRNIRIADDRTHVIVSAEIAKEDKNLIVRGTRFWVVRPRISFNSITGLGTLLSGAYIATDAGNSKQAQTRFTGLETPPRVSSDTPGRHFNLHAQDIGSLYVGAPVYFRRVPVGEVTSYKLDEDGQGVTLDVFVNTPNDRFVTANTRFWHASGIDVSLEGSGFKLNTESLVSVLVGGISFQLPPDSDAGPVAPSNTDFTLYPDKSSALRRIDQEVHTYRLYFSESLRGLSAGSAVDFRGINIGEVKSVGVIYDPANKTFRFPVDINVYPGRLHASRKDGGSSLPQDNGELRELLDTLVKRGFRAQLKTANLLTGQLYVALDFFPHAKPAGVEWMQNPPVLPTISGTFADIQESLGNIVNKLDKVPFDTIGTNLDQTLKSLHGTLQDADKAVQQLNGAVLPELRGTLQEAHKALGNAQRTLASDAPVQQDLRDALGEVSRAAQSLRALTDYLSRHPEALIRGRSKGE